MWASHHSDLWPDLDAREEPTVVGRRLDVGGFVFSDRPEAIFRSIGADYVRDAWHHLGDVLGRHEVPGDDLSWGMMHPGETSVEGVGAEDPGRYVGWTSPRLAAFDADPRWGAVDAALGRGSPPLRSAVTWRSLRWRIGGGEVALGLRLFEAWATDEYTEWSPSVVFSVPRDDSEPWVRAAAAIRDGDQRLLDRALAAAEQVYSAIGYRIVVRGYRAYADGWGLGLRFPALPERTGWPG
jgi:hypothetical protein